MPRRESCQGEAKCGHGKIYAKKLCRKCYEKDLKQRNPAYHERQKENVRKWVAANPDRKRRSDAAWRRRQSYEYRRSRMLRSRYGITLEDYDRMLEQQEGACAICGRPASMFKKPLHVDHCHATRRIRGLLCVRCNYCIGWWRENTDFLQCAIDYLEKKDGYEHKGPPVQNRRDAKERGLFKRSSKE